MINRNSRRTKFSISSYERSWLVNFGRAYGRSLNDIIRLTVELSTKDFKDFSIADGTFGHTSSISSRSRYAIVDLLWPDEYRANIIRDQARARRRSISSFMYAIVYHATKGFTDPSIISKETGHANT